jgi:hypothetical protein
MGKTTPTIAGLLHKERTELGRFRRALRKEDQLAFDELWVHVTKHMMACNQANHLLPLEIFFFAMLLEEHKEVQRLQSEIERLRSTQVSQ